MSGNTRLEVQAVGVLTNRLWTKLLKPEEEYVLLTRRQGDTRSVD
jgi:hypothetical protein